MAPDATRVDISEPSLARTVVEYPVGVTSIAEMSGAESIIPFIIPTPELMPTTPIIITNTRMNFQKKTPNLCLTLVLFLSTF